MEDLKTSISRILCLFFLLAGFDVTSAETQLPVRENIELQASSSGSDLTETFDGDNSIIPPVLETPELVVNSTTDSFCLSHSAPFQDYRLIAIRAPPHSSFIPA